MPIASVSYSEDAIAAAYVGQGGHLPGIRVQGATVAGDVGNALGVADVAGHRECSGSGRGA